MSCNVDCRLRQHVVDACPGQVGARHGHRERLVSLLAAHIGGGGGQPGLGGRVPHHPLQAVLQFALGGDRRRDLQQRQRDLQQGMVVLTDEVDVGG
jgi:hypothetical protein